MLYLYLLHCTRERESKYLNVTLIHKIMSLHILRHFPFREFQSIRQLKLNQFSYFNIKANQLFRHENDHNR